MPYSGPFIVRHEGTTLLEQQSARFRIITGNADVFTAHKGRAGFSRGAVRLEIDIDSAIPAEGLEVDWPGLAIAQEEVTGDIQIADMVYGYTADVREVDQESDASSGEARPNKCAAKLMATLISRTEASP
jgi:hypothetical protein